MCITWAVLSFACHQYFSKEGGNFLSKNPAAILSEELYQTRNLQQSNGREMSCQIFHYSTQGKLIIQRRNRSKLPNHDVPPDSQELLSRSPGPEENTQAQLKCPSIRPCIHLFHFYSVLFQGHHNQRSFWLEKHFANTLGIALWCPSPSSRQIMRMDWWMFLEPWQEDKSWSDEVLTVFMFVTSSLVEQDEGWFGFLLHCSVSYLFCKFTFYIRSGGNRRPEQARCNADSQIKCIHLVLFRSRFYTMQYSKDVT